MGEADQQITPYGSLHRLAPLGRRDGGAEPRYVREHRRVRANEPKSNRHSPTMPLSKHPEARAQIYNIMREFDEDGGLLMEFPEFCTMMLF